MFGRKKRKNIKKIRKEVEKIRKNEESKFHNKNKTNRDFSVFQYAALFIIIIYSIIKVGPSSEEVNLNEEKKELNSSTEISEKDGVKDVTENKKQKTQEELNHEKLVAAGLTIKQRHSLELFIDGKDLNSIEQIHDWALGERYRINVGWLGGYTYLVYYRGNYVQSINNSRGQLVYGSRPEY